MIIKASKVTDSSHLNLRSERDDTAEKDDETDDNFRGRRHQRTRFLSDTVLVTVMRPNHLSLYGLPTSSQFFHLFDKPRLRLDLLFTIPGGGWDAGATIKTDAAMRKWLDGYRRCCLCNDPLVWYKHYDNTLLSTESASSQYVQKEKSFALVMKSICGNARWGDHCSSHWIYFSIMDAIQKH